MSESEGRVVINERRDLDKALVDYWRNKMVKVMEGRKERGEYIYTEGEQP